MVKNCIPNRKDCDCSCHTNLGMVHVFQCCSNTAEIKDRTTELIDKLNSLLDRAIDDKFEQVEQQFEQDRDRGDETNG